MPGFSGPDGVASVECAAGSFKVVLSPWCCWRGRAGGVTVEGGVWEKGGREGGSQAGREGRRQAGREERREGELGSVL